VGTSLYYYCARDATSFRRLGEILGEFKRVFGIHGLRPAMSTMSHDSPEVISSIVG
jgi:hypothetical protein